MKQIGHNWKSPEVSACQIWGIRIDFEQSYGVGGPSDPPASAVPSASPPSPGLNRNIYLKKHYPTKIQSWHISGVIHCPYKPGQCPQQFIKSTQCPPPFWVFRAVYLSFWCVPGRFPYKTAHLWGGHLYICSGQFITNLNIDLFQVSYLWIFLCYTVY
jgi:hypothetical protein